MASLWQEISIDADNRMELTEDWALWGPAGGVLAATVLRGATESDDEPGLPSQLQVQFLSQPQFGVIQVKSNSVHRTRSTRLSQIELWQEDKLCVLGLVRHVTPKPGLAHDIAHEPVNPPTIYPEVSEVSPYPYWSHFQSRPVHDIKGEPRYSEWIRYRDTVPDDVVARGCYLTSAMDPFCWVAAGQAHIDPAYQAISQDLTVTFHRLDEPFDWLFVEHLSPVASSGTAYSEGAIWNENGQRLASCISSLRCIPRTREVI